jgi:tetratricopeptide (TPR) repeat protein
LPGNIVLNQKLIEICEQAQRWPAAIAACEALTEAFVMAGDGESAARYGELQARYQAISEGGSEGGSPAPSSGADLPPGFEMPVEFAVPESTDSPAEGGMAEFAIPEAYPMGIAEMQTPASAPEDTITLPPEFTSDEQAGSATGIHEVDLSGEWEKLMGGEEAAEPSATFDLPAPEPEAAPEGPSEADRMAEEIAADLSAGMISEASLALETMRALAPEDPRLVDLESQVQQAVLGGTSFEPTPEPIPEAGATEIGATEIGATTDFSEFNIPSETAPETAVSPLEWPSEPPAFELPVETPVEETVAPPPPVPEPAPAPVAAVPIPSAPAVQEDDFSLDLEHPGAAPAADDFELDLDLDLPEAPPAAPAPPSSASAPPPLGMADLLGAVVESLGDLAPAPAPPPKAAPPATAPQPAAKKTPAHAPAQAAGTGGLADVFADFKQEMEQDAAVDSDVENHYNMGMAFKEMGLYDEAIGEFQKAFHGAENSPSHPNFIPICSLLAHCFLEKRLPELAVTWLQKALKAPGLDREGEMALRYEIGSAQEAAGQKGAAMESFMLVYALNIDYRDVADRIRSLKGN